MGRRAGIRVRRRRPDDRRRLGPDRRPARTGSGRAAARADGHRRSRRPAGRSRGGARRSLVVVDAAGRPTRPVSPNGWPASPGGRSSISPSTSWRSTGGRSSPSRSSGAGSDSWRRSSPAARCWSSRHPRRGSRAPRRGDRRRHPRGSSADTGAARICRRPQPAVAARHVDAGDGSRADDRGRRGRRRAPSGVVPILTLIQRLPLDPGD